MNHIFPTQQVIFLEITCKKDFESIAIFDLEGKPVFQKTFKQLESNQKFDVSFLHRGVYFVNIFDANKKVLSFKIFKR